jgi:TRAP-type mannitol/chloroaromatic compound transport system permease small subunit
LATTLRELARKIDALQDRFGRAVSWLMLAMVVVVFGDVIMRYALKTSYVFAQELEWHLFGMVYLLAAGYTMLYDEHVRVDILYSRWSPRRKAWADFILYFVFFYPSAIMVIYSSWPFVRNSFLIMEGSPDPGGIPLRFVLKSVIIIGFALLLLQAISQTIKSYFVARGWEAPAVRQKDIV